MICAGYATRIAAAALALMCGLTGCGYHTFHHGHLTALSSKRMPERFEVIEDRVVGRGCEKMLMFLSYGEDTFSLEEAVRDAVSKAPGADSLINARASTTLLPLFVYNEMCYRVTGTAVRAQGHTLDPPGRDG
jgi:hypothetical protein